MVSLGTYPEVTLAEARQRRDDARRLLANGVDPSNVRKEQRAAEKVKAEATANTFEAVAREWHETNRSGWVPAHASTIMRRLERDVFPFIGSTPVAEVSPPAVLELLRRVEARGANETAKRTKVVIGQAMRYAVATGRAESDPTQSLRGALAPIKSKHFAAPTTTDAVRSILVACEAYSCCASRPTCVLAFDAAACSSYRT